MSIEAEPIQIARVILYVRDIPKVAAFYQQIFGLKPLPGAEEGWLELGSLNGGCSIALHQASAGQKRGAEIKISFGIKNVREFIVSSAAKGLEFGAVHSVSGFEFANAKDPAGNSIQISSRGIK